MGEIRFEIQEGPFKPEWESLRQFEPPQWFKDAKLGFWAHWGPQSVSMYGDWYARNMYIEGSDQYLYHWRIYGHPSKFGYKDIVKLWKAEKFDPEGLIDLYIKAGARYFVAQAVHHDNFDNWNSTHHRWNAVKVGPKKDIVGMWYEAARKRGLPFGVSEHLGATFSWFAVNKGCDKEGPHAGVPYDGNDPEYEDLYLPNRGEDLKKRWYTDNPWWHRRWFERIKDLIDQYHPDLLYTDGTVPFGPKYPEPGLHIIAHLYNTSFKLHGRNQAVYTQKDRNPDIYPVGVLDIERGIQNDIFHAPWQTDTCLGGWFYNVRQRYKKPGHVIHMLIDIVSKNGNLLLNVPQKPDGTIDEECMYVVKEMAKWIKINGEGIYGTRPWRSFGEGPTGYEKESEPEWAEEDFRFTAKDGFLYVFQMRWPESGIARVKSLGRDESPEVASVKLLGYEGEISFEQHEGALEIRLPQTKVCDYAHCFKIQFRS